MEDEVLRVPANPLVLLELLSTLDVAIPGAARVHQVQLEPKVPSNSSYTLKITSKNFVIRVGHGVLLRCGPIVDPLLFYS